MWLVIVTIGYLLNAISSVVNKSLLNKDIPNPVVYTFYICILGLAVFALAPFGLAWIGFNMFIISLIAGILFTGALLSMFTALLNDEVSRVIPLIGGLQPVFVFWLAFFFLGERLLNNQVIAFVLVLLGGLLITIRWQKASRQQVKLFFLSLLSALLFALSFVLSKYIFDSTDFISGFIWTRVGSFLGAVVLLLWAVNRKAIFGNVKTAGRTVGLIFILGQVAGALSFIMINWAMAMGSVTLVNALQGLQYVFLFIIVLLLAKRYPEWLKENTRGLVLVQKIIAILLISGGLYLLV